MAIWRQVTETTISPHVPESAEVKGATGLHGPQNVRLGVALIQRELVLGVYRVF
jgi:hypothetical protein